MNSTKYRIQNYVTTNPSESKKFFDLDVTLKRMTFEEIMADLEFHFENSYITNFDLIHHECRRERFLFSRKYYETISYKKFNEEITDNANQQKFISSAIKCERKDVFIKKKLIDEHFSREKIEEDLKKFFFFL